MSKLRSIEYRYIVGIAFVLGMFMELLDMTITNVALPTLAREFDANTTTVEWVITGYLLSLAVVIPASGWAGDRFGTKRIFILALAIFTVASFLCGLAWSAESLILFRVLQGVGGGMLTPVGMAMLFRAFPPAERAKASALLALPTAVAPSLGPVLGGYLVEFHSWNWIFFINVPIGLAGLVFAAVMLREERQPAPGRLDLPGFLLSAVGLSAIVYALAEAGSRGFGDERVVLLGLAGIVLLAALVVVELHTAEPMLDMRLFADRLFSASVGTQLVGFAALSGVLFLLPIFLQAERGLSPFESGLTTFPQSLGVISMIPVAGRLYPRLGPRRMIMAGLTGLAATTFAFLAVDLETDLWLIRGLMLARGWGFAWVMLPIQAAAFATIAAASTGRASSLSTVIRQVASSLGVALLATVLTNRLAHHDAVLGLPATRASAVDAFHDAFFVGGLVALAGVAAAFLIRDRDAAGTMVRKPRAEAPREGASAAQ